MPRKDIRDEKIRNAHDDQKLETSRLNFVVRKPCSLPFFVKYFHVNRNSVWVAYAPSRFIALRYPTRCGKIASLRTIKSITKTSMISAHESYHELSRFLDDVVKHDRVVS